MNSRTSYSKKDERGNVVYTPQPSPVGVKNDRIIISSDLILWVAHSRSSPAAHVTFYCGTVLKMWC